MKRLQNILTIFAVAVMLSACGGSSNETTGGAKKLTSGPDWYSSRTWQDDDNFLYVYGYAESPRQNTAEQKAKLNGNAEMGRKLGTKIEALQKSFEEEIQAGNEVNYSSAFTNATKSITSQKFSGMQTHKIEFYQKDDGTIQCYVCMKLPIGDARAGLENALSREEELYVKFKESKAFDELQSDLARIGG